MTFSDKSSINNLKVNASDLNVVSLNGLNLTEAAADLVLVDENAEIAGPLIFTSNVAGNYGCVLYIDYKAFKA